MARARSPRAARVLLIVAAVAMACVIGTPNAARAQLPTVGGMRAAQFVYQTTLERDASTIIIGTRTVSVSPASYAGAPAWLLVETRAGDAIAATDSLFLDASGTRPIHWSAAQGGARVAAEFRGDTAFGGVTSPMGRRSMIMTLPHGTLVNAAMLENALRLAPLQTAWEDSASTLSVTLGSSGALPARMSVIGDDRVRGPAGTFDCWVVAVHADPARGLYWVTKSDPMVVRSTLDIPLMGGAQLVNSLQRVVR